MPPREAGQAVPDTSECQPMVYSYGTASSVSNTTVTVTMVDVTKHQVSENCGRSRGTSPTCFQPHPSRCLPLPESYRHGDRTKSRLYPCRESPHPPPLCRQHKLPTSPRIICGRCFGCSPFLSIPTGFQSRPGRRLLLPPLSARGLCQGSSIASTPGGSPLAPGFGLKWGYRQGYPMNCVLCRDFCIFSVVVLLCGRPASVDVGKSSTDAAT